jgi:uncharacterized protein YukE
VKFDLGVTTLGTLAKATSGAGDDLGTLVRAVASAAEPLEGKFRGAGRAKFDEFHSRVGEISSELNAALSAVLAGIQGQDRAFRRAIRIWLTCRRRYRARSILIRPGSRPGEGGVVLTLFFIVFGKGVS